MPNDFAHIAALVEARVSMAVGDPGKNTVPDLLLIRETAGIHIHDAEARSNHLGDLYQNMIRVIPQPIDDIGLDLAELALQPIFQKDFDFTAVSVHSHEAT